MKLAKTDEDTSEYLQFATLHYQTYLTYFNLMLLAEAAYDQTENIGCKGKKATQD
jgi:hypothetical protein